MASNHIGGGHPTYDVAHLQDHLVWIQNLIENLPRTIDVTVGDKVDALRRDTNVGMDNVHQRLLNIEAQLTALGAQQQQLQQQHLQYHQQHLQQLQQIQQQLQLQQHHQQQFQQQHQLPCPTCRPTTNDASVHATNAQPATTNSNTASSNNRNVSAKLSSRGVPTPKGRSSGGRGAGRKAATPGVVSSPEAANVESAVVVRPKSSAAAASIARRVLPRGSFAQFEWTTGDQHPVPEDWKFPQSTCMAMWELWFHGDSVGQLCPFRHLLGADLNDPNSKRSMYVARRVMKVLIDLAISKGVASTEDALADLPDLRAVYHQCFEAMSVHPTLLSKPLDIEKWSTCSYMTVYDALQKGRRANQHELTFTWSDGSLHLTPEGYRLPATNCSVMWQMWFRGDAAAGIGPFRYLKESDVDNRQDLYRARKAMNMLVEVAIEQGIVTSQDDLMALSDEELETAFELAFDDYALQTHGDDKGPTPQDMSVRRLYESLQKRKRIVDEAVASSVLL